MNHKDLIKPIQQDENEKLEFKNNFNNPTMKLDFEEVPNGFLVTLHYAQQKSLIAANKLMTRENVTEGRLTLILNLIQNNPQLTTEKIAEKLKLTKQTILRDIDKLIINNSITYIGSARSGYGKILNQ